MARHFFIRSFGWVALSSLALLLAGTESLPQWGASPALAQEQRLETMTLARLEDIVRSQSDAVEGENGQWEATLGERSMLIVTHTEADRMRLVMPIKPASELSVEEVQSMMLANFHSALDARYAVSNGIVVAVFIHPLSTLQERDARSAILQVNNLVENFGGSYASSAVGFGGTGAAQETEPEALEI